jgi:HEAT repeat protein
VLEALTQVLREEADSDKRATAAYLLAYSATPEQTVERLVPFIRDPDSSVRNNVLRVLIATQEQADHPLVDVATVVDALSMPETSDRNKSLYLLKMLLEDLKPEALKAQRAPLIRELGPRLVEMVSLQNPIIREPATEVLKLLSGEAYETPEQWKAWLARQGT